jgi:hypothetical protein
MLALVLAELHLYDDAVDGCVSPQLDDHVRTILKRLNFSQLGGDHASLCVGRQRHTEGTADQIRR